MSDGRPTPQHAVSSAKAACWTAFDGFWLPQPQTGREKPLTGRCGGLGENRRRRTSRNGWRVEQTTHKLILTRTISRSECLMHQFRKKPVVIEASVWRKNGDHPLDYSKTHVGFEKGEMRDFPPVERAANGWEGDVVRYYRVPNVRGDTPCKRCCCIMHSHGWIDTLEGGHIVCPGDWIITGVHGEHYPCKPDIFAATYDPVVA